MSAVRAAVAGFRLVVRLCPAGFRRTFGDAMCEAFADEAAEVRTSRGLVPLLRLTVSAYTDAVLAAAVESRKTRAQSSRQVAGTRGGTMRSVWQDLHYAVRVYRRNPGFALAALVTLSLGIAATTAVFSAVNGMLLRPLPYPDPDRLVRVWGRNAHAARSNVNPLDAADWRREAAAVQSLGLITTTTQPVTGTGEPVAVPVAFVTPAFLETLGARAAMGRLFGQEHETAGHRNEIVVSDGFWRGALGADPAVLGRTIMLSDVGCTIIGVLPRAFVSPGIPAVSEPQIWRPYVIDPQTGRGGHFMAAVARLAPGATIDEAQAQIDATAARLAREFPSTNLGQGAALEPLQEAIVSEGRSAVLVLTAAVAAVLLIACANVANLLLARASGRAREMAIRGALGAGRRRVVRQLMTESLLLAGVAGLAGTGVAAAAVSSIPAVLADGIPLVIGMGIDWRVLAFTAAVSIGTSIAFGLVPALQASRFDLREALAIGGRSAAGGPGRLQSALLVVETALALLLLVSATLLIQSFVRLQRVDPGFDDEHVLTFRVTLPRSRYDTPARRTGFFDDVVGRLRALPGVEAAGAVNMSPLAPRYSCDSFGLADRPAPPDGEEPCAESRIAAGEYFRAMGIPVLAGRTFGPEDTAAAAPVLVVNESMARKYWPSGGALGQRFKWGSVASDDPWRTIVGIVRDVKHFGLDAEAAPEVYMPAAQMSSSAMTIAVRTPRDPAALAADVRRVVGAADQSLPLAEVFTTRELIDRSTALARFRTQLLGGFAAVAVVLAVVGVYGVMAFYVAQRRREIGIRVALGAGPGEVRRLVIGRGMRAALCGVGIGLVGAFLTTRLLSDLLFEVDPVAPFALAFASAVLIATALAASYLPARQATKVDPAAAIGTE
jgi:putative ABC transport system permease protein